MHCLDYGCHSLHNTKNTKKFVSLRDYEVQTFLEGEGNQYTKGKTESYIFSGFSISISLG